jgi:predicted kinase
LCGLPGAGKTTRAKRLECRLAAVRLCPDEWMAALAVGFRDEPFRERLERVFWCLAQTLLARGQSVILDSGFWLRADRDEKRLGARALGAAVELHYLDVPLEELWRRIEGRNATSAPAGTVPIRRVDLELWSTLFEAPDATELALFDPPGRP